MSRDPLIKVYASLYPADAAALEAVNAVLASWYVEDAAELAGDLLRISHEGEYFPTGEVVEALKPFLREDSRGRLDEIDLEAWTLRLEKDCHIISHGQQLMELTDITFT